MDLTVPGAALRVCVSIFMEWKCNVFSQAQALTEAVQNGAKANIALKRRFSATIEDVVPECPTALSELVVSFINPIELTVAEN